MNLPDPRQFAAASERNRAPILAVLRRILPQNGHILEIASGSGQHALYFTEHLPALSWQPSDPNPESRASIDAWTTGTQGRILPPLDLDTTHNPWPVAAIDGIVAINMVHIAPWAATIGLFAGARRHLRPEAPLFLYGPYLEADVPTAPGNLAFDANLRRQNPCWGLRDLGAVIHLAHETGFRFDEKNTMPANNLALVFRRLDQ